MWLGRGETLGMDMCTGVDGDRVAVSGVGAGVVIAKSVNR